MDIITNEVKVSVPFSVTDGTYTLNDAIVLSQAEFDSITEAELQARKEERFTNYRAFIIEASSKEPVPPTEEDLEAELEQLVETKEAIILREQELLDQLGR